MDAIKNRPGWRKFLALAGFCLAGIGCHTMPVQMPIGMPPDAPRELSKVTLPPYKIEPPDILQIEAVVLDLDEKTGEPLKSKQPVALWPQPVTGQFHVKPDGTVMLGIYGEVQVTGLTVQEAREAIQGFLAHVTKLKPQAIAVAVDVVQFNSKTYYVITDGAGFGEGVFRFPVVGSETVLDAISNIQGLHQVASKRHIWIARRGPNGGPNGCPDQILPVDWCGITRQGDTRTNYQVMPGDRIYIMAQPLIRTNNGLQKLLAPIQQGLGITLLGAETVNAIRGVP
jgi:polysaccharide export outer membrane protein